MKKEEKSFLKGYLWFIIIIVSIMLTFVGMYSENDVMIYIGVIGDVAILLVGMIVLIGSWGEEAERQEKEAELMAQIKQELEQYANIRYGVVSLTKRDSRFIKAFSIDRDMITPMSYNPEKYIYTSATVGGITTGGIDKVGGNYVKGKELHSGKFVLNYYGEKVERIQLTDKLYKQAQKSPIKKYLDGVNQIVVEEKADGAAIVAAMMLGAFSADGQILRHDGYPTYEKCREIIAWICEAEKVPDCS